MPLKKNRPVLLFFYAKDITQGQTEAIVESFKDYDVYFRKVLHNTRDTLEPFDAVAGDVPAMYIAAADAKSLKVFDYETNAATLGTSEVVDQSGGSDLSGTKGTTSQESTAVVPPDALKPTDAAKATTSTTAPPPPAPAPAKG